MDAAASAALLLEDCVLVPRDDLVRIEVRGADRLDYLHRMLTQELARLPIGRTTYACLLTVKGRILGDLLVSRREDCILLELPRAAEAAVLPLLERYVIADDVHFEACAPAPRATLVGPRAPARLKAEGLPVPENGASETVGDFEILRFDRRGLPHLEIVGDTSAWALPRVSREVLDLARVAYAIPAFGPELGEGVLFNEAGLEEAISWTKGCYPGQEPVVMAKHRGRPPRRLVKISHAGGALAPGTPLLLDGREIGQVTSAAPAIGPRPAAALAFVRVEHAQVGQVLEVPGGLETRIALVSGERPPEEQA
jgi:folate-binding protein YgfZ